jgi:hypothetical protein
METIAIHSVRHEAGSCDICLEPSEVRVYDMGDFEFRVCAVCEPTFQTRLQDARLAVHG